MKSFAFIMALIVLALSCMPCMDEASAMSNDKAKAQISKSNSPEEHNDIDNCSPFCACNCCSGFTFVITTHQIENPILPSSEKASSFLPAEIINISLPIWQPPQLFA